MSTGSVSSTTSSTQNSTANNAFNNLQPSDFLNMLITELQNQDPLNPMQSSQLLTEMSQISAISSNQQLASTLQSVASGQSLSAAAGLLQKTITGLDPSGNTVSGQVQSVSLANGVATLNIGNDTVSLSNVSQVQ